MLRYLPDFWMYGYDCEQKPLKFAGLELVTAPTAFALTTSDGITKTSLRVDASDEDSLIEQHISAATDYCQDLIPGGRQFITATWDLPISGFWAGSLGLPLPPLQSVTSVKYYATDGTLTTLASSYYGVRTPRKMRGTITREPDQVWPTVQSDRPYPVIIRFVCGYGASGASVPAAVKQAMLIACGWFYQDREPTDRETKAIENLLRSEGYGAYP